MVAGKANFAAIAVTLLPPPLRMHTAPVQDVVTALYGARAGSCSNDGDLCDLELVVPTRRYGRTGGAADAEPTLRWAVHRLLLAARLPFFEGRDGDDKENDPAFLRPPGPGWARTLRARGSGEVWTYTGSEAIFNSESVRSIVAACSSGTWDAPADRALQREVQQLLVAFGTTVDACTVGVRGLLAAPRAQRLRLGALSATGRTC